MKRTIVLAGIMVAAWCVATNADIITTDDGRTYEGTAVTVGDEVKVTTKMGVLTFPKEKVVKIEKVKSSADVYREKAAGVKDDDAEGHYQLALWCREKKLFKEMNQEYEKTIAANPEHEAARSALNYVKIGAEWVKAKAGMVYVEGKWLKPDEAVEQGKALYKVEKYEDAYRAFDGAVKNLKKESDLAGAQLNLGLTAERLGKWEEAKAAYGEILGMKSNVVEKPVAEAHKSVIEASTGGMYLVKEPTGKEDIFSLDSDQKEKIKKLAGLQPLSNAEVMDIALREKCIVYIEKGKVLLKQAKDANTGTPEGDKKSNDLIDQAEEQFQAADRTVKDLARGFLVECVKQRIAIVDNTYRTKVARVQGQLMRLQGMTDRRAQEATAIGLCRELDELLKQLDVIQKLAGQYPDELAQQVASTKEIRKEVTALKVRFEVFVGKK